MLDAVAIERERFWARIYAEVPSTLEVDAGIEAVLRRAIEFFGGITGKTVIDLGCGQGATSVFLARQGARVLAVDSSAAAVAQLRTFCRTNGLDNVECICEDALHIDRIGPCDAIFGSMILHHIEPFEDFARALQKVLSSGARGFFYENSAASRALMWCRDHVAGRWWIPKFGEPGEYPLTPDEIDDLRDGLRVQVEYPQMYFFRLLSGYILKGRLQKSFAQLDDFLFRHRLLVRYSYRQYVMVEAR